MIRLAVSLCCLLPLVVGERSTVKAWSMETVEDVPDDIGIDIRHLVYDEDTKKSWVFGFQHQQNLEGVMARIHRDGTVEKSYKFESVVAVNAARMHPTKANTLIVAGVAKYDTCMDCTASFVGFLDVDSNDEATVGEPVLVDYFVFGDSARNQHVPLVAVDVFPTMNMFVAVGDADGQVLDGDSNATMHGVILAAFDLDQLHSPLWAKANLFNCDSSRFNMAAPPFGAARYLKDQLLVVTQGAQKDNMLPSMDVCRFQVQRDDATTVYCRKFEDTMNFVAAGVHTFEHNSDDGGSWLLVPGTMHSVGAHMLKKINLTDGVVMDEQIFENTYDSHSEGSTSTSLLDADNEMLYLGGNSPNERLEAGVVIMNPLLIKYDLSMKAARNSEQIKEVREFEKGLDPKYLMYRPNFVEAIVQEKDAGDILMVAKPNSAGNAYEGDEPVQFVTMKRTKCMSKKSTDDWSIDDFATIHSVPLTADYFGDVELLSPENSYSLSVQSNGGADMLRQFCSKSCGSGSSSDVPAYGIALIIIAVITVLFAAGFLAYKKLRPSYKPGEARKHSYVQMNS